METLKKNVNNITNDAESIVRGHLKLFSIQQSQRLAKVLGILFSIFIISILLLVVVLFCSFALAVYLNDILSGDYLGFFIVAGFYVILVLYIIVRMLSSKTPLMSNVFMKFISLILDIDTSFGRNIEGMELETEQLKEKIENDKTHLQTNIQLLRYSFIESLFKEFVGLFVSRKKRKRTDSKKKSSEKTSSESKK